MSKFSIELDSKRPCRYVFEADLWDSRLGEFSEPVDVLLDTGSFNTIIDGRALVPVRMLAEAIGANVEWDANTRMVVIS